MCSNSACTGRQARAISDTYDETIWREAGEQENAMKIVKGIYNLEHEYKTMVQKDNKSPRGIHTPNENTTIAFRTAVWLAPSAADTIVCWQIVCFWNKKNCIGEIT